MATTCPLLLENQGLIDALGYIDVEYNDATTQQVVQHLIRAEMTKFPPSPSYLDFLPEYSPTFSNRPRLQTEYRRVKANVPLNAIDINRYQVREPSGVSAEDVATWAAAVRKLQVNVELQSDRVLNLELQQAYGAKLWKTRATILDGLNSQLDHQLTGIKKTSADVNVKRKHDQMLNANKLQSYQSKFDELVRKNSIIKRACIQRDAQLQKTVNVETPEES